MAAMDTALVRTYRDIDGWDARRRDTQGLVQTLWRSIMNLDEQIAIIRANAPPGYIETWGFISFAHGQAVMTRARLYNQLVNANQLLRELRDAPNRETRLQEYLEACHSIDLAIKARDLLPPISEVLQHDVIERTLFPQHLVPATDFAVDQMSVWRNLIWSADLRFRACYPSFNELEFLRAHVDGSIVSCPGSLFKFMKMAVDEAVNAILDQIVRERNLVRALEIDREFDFDSYMFVSCHVSFLTTASRQRLIRQLTSPKLPSCLVLLCSAACQPFIRTELDLECSARRCLCS